METIQEKSHDRNLSKNMTDSKEKEPVGVRGGSKRPVYLHRSLRLSWSQLFAALQPTRHMEERTYRVSLKWRQYYESHLALEERASVQWGLGREGSIRTGTRFAVEMEQVLFLSRRNSLYTDQWWGNMGQEQRTAGCSFICNKGCMEVNRMRGWTRFQSSLNPT